MTKEELTELIEIFYNQWIQYDDTLWRNNFFPKISKGYLDFEIKVSFGQGLRIVPPKNPWIAFLKYEQRVSQGIYPIIIIQDNLLKVFLGVSRDNDANLESHFIKQMEEQLGYKEFKSTEIENLVNHIDHILRSFDSQMNEYIQNPKNIFRKKYNSFIKSLPSQGSGKYAKLFTSSRQTPFKLYRNSANGITIKAFTAQSAAMSTNLQQLSKIVFDNSSPWYTSYEPMIIERIQNNNIINEEELKNEESDNSSSKNLIMDSKIKNIILYGSPGVGKTHNINKLISLIESGISEIEIFNMIKNNELNDGVDANNIIDNIYSRVKFITFHQSFGYEDFIEGFRPNVDGNIKLQDGIFKSICDDANNDKENKYYLVIDEINRGNISKIFGELITLIEENKRDTLEVTLPYSKKPFKIPSNLYIIGTMNSTDKSIALIDIALRRRFTFLKMKPKADLIDYPAAREIFENLNNQIEEDLGEDYQLGHSYFMNIKNQSDLDFVLEYKIIPLLEEYYYGDANRFKEIEKLCKKEEG